MISGTTDRYPLLSVVVPVHNRRELVIRTLDSIHTQTLRPFNLIIVDSASTDDTLVAVNNWADRFRTEDLPIEVVSNPIPGASAARNLGLQRVTTPYVLFFDSDDEMRPTHLERIERELCQHPDTDILMYDVANIDPDGWTSVKSHRHHDLKALHMMHGVLSTLRYTVRTKLIRAAGGWNEELHTWDDLELGVRLLMQPQVRVRRLEGDPTAWIHQTDDSLSGTSMRARAPYHAKALAAIDRIASQYPDSNLRMLVHARRVVTAAQYCREGDAEAAKMIMQPVEDVRLPLKTSMMMGLIYTVTRLTGHGGSFLTLKWFGNKRPKS